ncbi:MAG TPA: hypothetical protein VMG11_15075 [Steroidobacteraceae bacterium]|nr:hypothetical protein [Steroidobacteraceae bacterium]
MKAKTILAASVMIAAATAISAADQAPAAPHVTEVITVDVGANMQKFRDMSRRIDGILKGLQFAGKVRYYETTWAGTSAGHVIVTVEYPSLVILAQSVAKLNASPDFQKWEGDMQASGIKVLSESLITELRM